MGGFSGGLALSYATAGLVLGLGLVVAWAWVSHIERGGRPVARTSTALKYGDLEGKVVAKILATKACRWARNSPDLRAIETFGTNSRELTAPATTFPRGLRPGDPLGIGQTLSLSSGAVVIVYESGVELTLEGPAEYVVDRLNGGELRLGKATVRGLGKGLVTAGPARRAGQDLVGGTPTPQDLAGKMPTLQEAEPGDLLAAAQQVYRYHRTRFSVRTPRVVVIERGGDFGLRVNAAGEVRTDLIAGCVELWYPQGVTDKDTLGGGRFWGYAAEDTARGGFRAVCQVGESPLSVRMEMADAQRNRRGIFVTAQPAALLDQWRTSGRAKSSGAASFASLKGE